MAAPETSIAVVAEKPSVARDLARVLGAAKRGEGYIHGNGYVVTWAIGHLVELAKPGEIRPEWRSWRRESLPMLPESWPLVVGEQTKDQFEVVRKILTSPRITGVVCATDAGREGELIFRYIYEAAGSGKPVQRLWISSLTTDAIRDGFGKLRDGHDYDRLADAAKGRSRADWLVGMNLSRAYTLACNEEISVGRVQTPTLAMLVERELAIRNFVPEDYRNVVATFAPVPSPGVEYKGTWFRPGVEGQDAAAKLPADGEEAAAIVARVKTGAAQVERLERQTKRLLPPLLYDLTELQRHANRLYGFSAQRTLDLAQALYEKHKLISYPRTDSRHLSQDVARTLPGIVRAIAGDYEGKIAPGTGERPLGRNFVDDTKVSDHHAIIPTGENRGAGALDNDERRVYDLICRRLLQAWHEDHLYAVTTVVTLVTSPAAEDRFHSSGTQVLREGWKVLDIAPAKKKDEAEEPALPPELAEAQPQRVVAVESVAKKTRAPKRFSEAALLTAMETAGKNVDDRELSEAMKDNGLGTPATRASIIEVLLRRGFIVRRGKSLEATEKGIRLIEVVHPEVKSPAMTGQWEAFLKRIERGQAELQPFIEGIEKYVTEVVGRVAAQRPAASPRTNPIPIPAQQQVTGAAAAATAPAPARIPHAAFTGDLRTLLRERFGFEAFRPHQEDACRAVANGQDVLLVMPTGSGKSLCYQLPGVALGGTTLVVSPLIALMEDQIAKLQAQGFRAERIHSNRDRAASRQASIDYLNGQLDFLFIAPERLRVQGFPEMLAKRKPALIAIDEAHCISQWGHDFRPDYRTMGGHLPALRPAPVIALTATATPLVQRDIAAQLGLAQPRHFIHGFRRDNIAIEVVQVPSNSRASLALKLLEDESRRPAIVYVPTRREAEALAAKMERDFAAAPYHAGMSAKRRDEVQRDFLAGTLDVIVATIAFGMGVDKPDIRTIVHTALPGSVEGYYQEIGRAGRDGLPSRAILMHDYADRFTHDFFFKQSYPEVDVLDTVFNALAGEMQPKEVVRKKTKLDQDAFDTALEKLWIHRGALADAEDNVARGERGYSVSYLEQRDYKIAQFNKVISYCRGAGCRMLALLRYFGDHSDLRRSCGVCDYCAPDAAIAQRCRPPSVYEQGQMAALLSVLREHSGLSSGRLHAAALGRGGPADRRACEDLVNALARGGLVTVIESSFEKDGREIEYRKVQIEDAGLEPGAEAQAMVAEEVIALDSPGARKTTRKRRAAAASPKAGADKNAGLADALRKWRSAEAKKKSLPAFRIFTDKVLNAIAAEHPADEDELLEIPGVGARLVAQYGPAILRLIAGFPGST